MEAGLQQLLLADAAVSALAATRIFPLILPVDAAVPAATYQRISTVTLNTLTENISLTQARLQIDTWANSYADARALASAITDVLEGFNGSLTDGTFISDIVLDSQIDLYDSVSRLYRVSLDFLIWFSRL